MAKVELIKKDGFPYERHSTSIENGKKFVGNVDVLCPEDLDHLTDMIDSNMITEKTAMRMFTKGLTHTMQANLRQQNKTGKMNQQKFIELVCALTTEERNDKTPEQIKALVQKKFAAGL